MLMKLQNPVLTVIDCLCETELNLFTRNAPRLKKVINWLDSEKLYLDCGAIGKRYLTLNA